MMVRDMLSIPLGHGYRAYQRPVTCEGSTWSLVFQGKVWMDITVGFRANFRSKTIDALEDLMYAAEDHRLRRGKWKPSEGDGA